MSAWGTNQEMNELEATMWRGENHPTHSTQGGVLMRLESSPGRDAVLRAHEYGVGRFRRFRQRVVEPAVPLGPPAWVDDERFDLAYHLRFARLPGSSGTEAQLLEMVQTLAVTPLDRRRALWSATFVEGLEGGRAAYFLTVHHCLMDGHASIQLLGELFEPTSHEPAPSAGHGATSGLGLAAGQAAGRLLGSPKLATNVAATAVAALKAGPRKSLEFAASVGRVLAPPPKGGSELMKGGSRTQWRYGVLECELDALKRAAKAAGGTVNDAYVAAVLGGLRRYHEARGLAVGDITINIPVSVRKDADAEGGNRFAVAFIAVPSSEPDPAARIAKLRAAIGAVRGEPALDFFSLVLPALNRAPAALLEPLFTSMQERADLTISNVAGMPHAVSFMGADVERIYYFGPLAGSAVMSVMCSHDGTCCIGVNCDGEVFEDPAALLAGLADGLQEVLDLGH